MTKADALQALADAEEAERRLSCALHCHALLIEARQAAKDAGAPQTLKRIRRALTSSGGAIRNATGRIYRAQR